ncbi:MAG TPA: MarR family transcriptional regulator [Solirubrobacteraceae bacterium]|nr:MarR family transcriptional regulator [Solirubrobacteraceae bacterium]
MKLSADDHVERVRAQWKVEAPELDTRPVAVVARVGRLARYFDQGLDRLFSEHGLRRESWDVLASLRRTGAPYRLSPTQLYLGLMRTSGAMTNRLHRLEHTGLIRRVADPADGRGMLVELTARGKRLVDELAPAHLANERAMLAALTAEEQRTLAALLAKLLAALEAQEGRPPRGARRRCRRRHR